MKWQSISIYSICSWKTELWEIWMLIFLAQYKRVGSEQETFMSESNQQNQIISIMMDVKHDTHLL